MLNQEAMKKTESALVVKSNRLIEASYRLDIVEQRLILMAIHEARETGLGITSNNFLSIRADEYAMTFGLDPKITYSQLKNAAKTLFHRYVVLHDIHPETGRNRTIEARWVSSVAYVEGSGLVQLKFGDDVVPYITRLEEKFTSYKIKSISKMTSTYAIRLYELLMQWKNSGVREIDLEKFKQILQVEGQYPALKDFKNRVLDLAITQINQFSDLDVSYENIKLGRKVTGFMFFFGEKPPKKAEKPTKKPKATVKPETATPKPKDPPAQTRPKASAPMISFSGLEKALFQGLKKKCPGLTEQYILDLAKHDGVEAFSVLQTMDKAFLGVDCFELE